MWHKGFDRQADHYGDQFASACTFLRTFLTHHAPEGILPPALYPTEDDTIEIAWHYRTDDFVLVLDIELNNDGEGDIYIWDSREGDSLYGEFSDVRFQEYAIQMMEKLAQEHSSM